MRVLMISTDRGLLAGVKSGDVFARHQAYAKQVERLDIIVLTKKPDATTVELASNGKVVTLGYFQTQKATHQYLNYRYDVVVCQDPFLTGRLGVKLKKKFGCKLIVHLHGDFFDNPYWRKEHWRHRIYLRLAKKVIPQADSIRAVSEKIKEKLIARGVAAHNMYVIPTPVALEKFEQNMPLPTQPTVLTVARIVKAKDFPTLISVAEKVAAAVPNLKWVIAGDGPLLKQMQQATSDKQYIVWRGNVDHGELVKFYSSSTLFVLTSTNESFGKVFLEAAMAHRPAVATATTGAQEIIIDGQTGYLAPIGDVERLSERIIYLLQHPEVVTQMGQAAHDHIVGQYGWDRSVKAIISMWQQTLGNL